MLISIYKFMCQSSLINLFHFCSVNLILKRAEMKAKFYFSTFIISNSQIEIPVSFSRSTYVNANMCFPNSSFEGMFSTYVFGNSFWNYRELKSECWTSRHILCKKILKFFICVEVRILVKSEICMKLTFAQGHCNKHADWKRLCV
jgi:hypothetical protein